MNKAPAIGSRVRFVGSLVNGPCIGVVLKHYPQDRYDDYGEIIPGKVAPEREWSIAMKPDALPEKWAYPGCDTFAPRVCDLRRA